MPTRGARGGQTGRARTGARASWEAIYAGLHEAILRHRLDPGAKLVEEEVAEVYGVSRTLVRSALQALAREGIVLIQPNRGAAVAHPSTREAREIFEARALIEPQTARLAAARMNETGLSRLGACLDAEHRALAADDPREAVYLSAHFHSVIAEIAGHAVLSEIVSGLLSRSSLVVALYWRRPEILCENAAHHALLDALGSGDGDGAARLMRDHMESLLEGLDLTERPPRRSTLAEALARP